MYLEKTGHKWKVPLIFSELCQTIEHKTLFVSFCTKTYKQMKNSNKKNSVMRSKVNPGSTERYLVRTHVPTHMRIVHTYSGRTVRTERTHSLRTVRIGCTHCTHTERIMHIVRTHVRTFFVLTNFKKSLLQKKILVKNRGIYEIPLKKTFSCLHRCWVG